MHIFSTKIHNCISKCVNFAFNCQSNNSHRFIHTGFTWHQKAGSKYIPGSTLMILSFQGMYGTHYFVIKVICKHFKHSYSAIKHRHNSKNEANKIFLNRMY